MTSSQADIIQKLSSSIRRMEHSRLEHFHKTDAATVSTGIKRLDSLLPNHGLLRGTLTEWVESDIGCGAMSLALLAAAAAGRQTPPSEDSSRKSAGRKTRFGKRKATVFTQRTVVVIDTHHSFCMSGAIPWGLSPRDTVLIRPRSANDALWALEQTLRHKGPAAVVCRLESGGIQGNDQVFRRLQLACETGNSLGLLIRPDTARRTACWAEVRFRITARPTSEPPEPLVPGILPMSSSLRPTSRGGFQMPVAAPLSARRVDVELMSARGRMSSQIVPLEICDATGCVRVAARVRNAAVSERTPRPARSSLRAV